MLLISIVVQKMKSGDWDYTFIYSTGKEVILTKQLGDHSRADSSIDKLLLSCESVINSENLIVYTF